MQIWQPLDVSRSEIRVLEVASTQSSPGIISCQLKIVSLLDKPDYEALSYVWGTPSDPEEIQLSGVTHPVTKNLYQALTALRHDDKTRILWVDAVCIHQADLDERSAQVGMMDRVYAYASQVVVWLQREGMPDLMHSIQTFGKDHARHYTEIPANLAHFSTRWDSWWFRVWTLQEAVLARHLVFHAGDDVFTIEDLEDYEGSLQHHLFRHEACCRSVQTKALEEAKEPFDDTMAKATITFLLNDRRTMQGGKQRLLDLVLRNTTRSATDPRDLVYGVTGLASEIPPGFIRYDLSLKDCVVHITSKMIQHSQSIELLRYVSPITDLAGFSSRQGARRGVENDYERMGDLPSWSPDWTQTAYPRTLQIRAQYRHLLHRRFSAAGITQADPSLFQANVLGVSGILCDTVAQVASRVYTVPGMGTDAKCLQEWCHLVYSSHAAHRACCDLCHRNIYGVRHRCTVCEDYDLCSRCFAMSEIIHPNHAFGEVRTVKVGDCADVPDVICAEDEDGNHHVSGSFWEMLEIYDYPFTKDENLQSAFRETLTASVPAINTVTRYTAKTIVEEVAFAVFWSTRAEEHSVVKFKAGRGYTQSDIRDILQLISNDHVFAVESVVGTILNGKRLFVSEKGYIGWGPEKTKVGDVIVVMNGGEMPFIVRQIEGMPLGSIEKGALDCTLVGETYVHGLMNGQALKAVEKGKLNTQKFMLY
jgi:hypothetical protein